MPITLTMPDMVEVPATSPQMKKKFRYDHCCPSCGESISFQSFLALFAGEPVQKFTARKRSRCPLCGDFVEVELCLEFSIREVR